MIERSSMDDGAITAFTVTGPVTYEELIPTVEPTFGFDRAGGAPGCDRRQLRVHRRGPNPPSRSAWPPVSMIAPSDSPT
jgi:hypothetical protein